MSKIFQLKNGLQVLLLESHKSPVVSVQMWVKTGSADEEKSQEGISHFIEHLVFKGTRKYQVGQIAAAVEGAGGELNAYTSFDQTVFYVTISKQFGDTALDVISEMMGFPTFDPQEVDNEREVVIEEIKRGQDSPGRRASQLLFSNVFRASPYGIPVIGYEKIIRKVSVKKIIEYYQSRYVPSNMFLVIAGDFESKEMRKKVQAYFSDFKPFKLKKVKRKKEPVQKSIRIKYEKTEFKQTVAYINWRIPDIKHKDIPALEVMCSILGQGDSSRLIKKLRIEKPLTNSVGAFAYAMRDDGLLAISINVEKENLQESLREITPEIMRMIEEPVSNEELQRAITNFASHEVYSLETVDNIARKAGSDQFYYEDPNYYQKYMKMVYSLTPADLQRVAKKYLKPDTFSISMISEIETKEAQGILRAFAKSLKASLGKAKVQKSLVSFKPQKFNVKASAAGKPPAPQKIVLKTGATLLIREQKETPYVAMKAAFLGGVRIESDSQPGVTEMFSRNWLSGTQRFSEEEINLRVEEMAAGIGAFGGRNSAGLGMSFLSPFTAKMQEIYTDALLHPIFPEQVLNREKVIMKNQIKARNDNPAQICVMKFVSMIFKNHPYSRDLLGTEETVDKLKVSDLKNYYQKIAQAKNLTFSVVGDVNTKDWIDYLEDLTAHLPRGERLLQSFKAPEIKKDQKSFVQLNKEQTHLILGYQGLTLTDPERYTLEIIQSILSGQGGRLFIELRDKNSLAYSVSPMHMEGLECGYFGGYIGCSPEKTAKAVEMMKAEFSKLASQKISPEELLRAQRYLIGRHDIELQRKSAVGNAMLFDDIYGLDYKKSLDVAPLYFDVTENDVLKLAEKIFSRPSVLSIVGPQDIK